MSGACEKGPLCPFSHDWRDKPDMASLNELFVMPYLEYALILVCKSTVKCTEDCKFRSCIYDVTSGVCSDFFSLLLCNKWRMNGRLYCNSRNKSS